MRFMKIQTLSPTKLNLKLKNIQSMKNKTQRCKHAFKQDNYCEV